MSCFHCVVNKQSINKVIAASVWKLNWALGSSLFQQWHSHLWNESITFEAFWTGLRMTVWFVSADVPKAFSLLTPFYLWLLCMVLLGSPVTAGRRGVQWLTLLLLRVHEQAVLSLSPYQVPAAWALCSWWDGVVRACWERMRRSMTFSLQVHLSSLTWCFCYE